MFVDDPLIRILGADKVDRLYSVFLKLESLFDEDTKCTIIIHDPSIKKRIVFSGEDGLDSTI